MKQHAYCYNAYIVAGFKELPPTGALMMYISADGYFSAMKHPEDSKCISGLTQFQL